MPSGPRSDVVDPRQIGTYHAWSRCVRRAFLMGKDPVTGKDYTYRRHWILDYMKQLTRNFAIDLGFHAILVNHIHAELRNRPDVVDTWSDQEVARRWLTISHLTKSYQGEPKEITDGMIAMEIIDPERVKVLRIRLSDPSYFMWALCEYVSRRCNREDGESGHFWERRFGCKKLEGDAAIVLCGVYIDLNQIRAGEALTPETSVFTSAYVRIEGMRFRQRKEVSAAALDTHFSAGQLSRARPDPDAPDAWLCELTLRVGLDVSVHDDMNSVTGQRASDRGLLPIAFEKYLELLDATGRALRADKKGAIPADLAPILERLGLNPDSWPDAVENYASCFGSYVGTAAELASRAATLGRCWLRGHTRSDEIFLTSA